MAFVTIHSFEKDHITISSNDLLTKTEENIEIDGIIFL